MTLQEYSSRIISLCRAGYGNDRVLVGSLPIEQQQMTLHSDVTGKTTNVTISRGGK